MANHLRVLSAVLFALLLLPTLGSGEVPIDDGSVSGEWFNPNRDGEGFFIEVAEVNGMPVFVVAWFTYNNGSQLWLVGSAMIPAGATSITVDVQMPSGADFGDAFDPAEVERTPWGTLTFSFESFNTGVVDYNSTLGFGSGSIDLVRLTKLVGIEQLDGASFSGRWEGLTSQRLPIALTVNDANRITLVEFDYQQLGEIHKGNSISIVGSAMIPAGATSITVDVQMPSGADFGDAFDPAEVERTPWGTLTFSFESFNTGVVDYNSTLGFGSGSIDLVRLTKLVGIEQLDGASFSGRWEGLTSQRLPIALTVNDANRITLVEFDYQQLGEIPPDPNCQHAVSVEPSALISANGTFSVDIIVPPSTTILQFDGRLSGSLSDSQGMGQWDFTRTILFCQRTPTSSTTNGCGGEFLFDSPCDDYDFSYDLSRME